MWPQLTTLSDNSKAEVLAGAKFGIRDEMHLGRNANDTNCKGDIKQMGQNANWTKYKSDKIQKQARAEQDQAQGLAQSSFS